MFLVLYGSGSLESAGTQRSSEVSRLQEAAALQFPESVQQLCPGCDLVLLTDVNPLVSHSLACDFSVHDVPFGTVATKWMLRESMLLSNTCYRFTLTPGVAMSCSTTTDVTVTFGTYDALYSLERDWSVLCQPPITRRHLFCLVLKRGINLLPMVNMCTQILQIRHPVFPASQCYRGDTVLIWGWQRDVVSSTMNIASSFKLVSPLCWRRENGYVKPITRYNKRPMHVMTSHFPQGYARPAKQKTYRKPNAKAANHDYYKDNIGNSQLDAQEVQGVPEVKEEVQDVPEAQSVQVQEMNVAVDNQQNQEECFNPFVTEDDWVLTAVCIEK